MSQSCWWLVVSAPCFWSDIVRFTSLFQLFLIFWMLQKSFLVHLIVHSSRPPTSLAHYTFLDTWYNSPTTTLLMLVYLSKHSLLFVHSSFFLSSWTFVQIWIFFNCLRFFNAEGCTLSSVAVTGFCFAVAVVSLITALAVVVSVSAVLSSLVFAASYALDVPQS